MDAATNDETISFLNELLEAERAGAKVTLETSHAASTPALAELMRAVQKDEARWCVMLLGHLKARGAAVTGAVGAFYGKAMAIPGERERLAFLNRGQGWVVKKIREMLPRVVDAKLHGELSEMLRSHEENIARANDFAATLPAAG